MSDVAIASLVPSVVLFFKQHPALHELTKDGTLGFDGDGLWFFQGDAGERPFRDPQGTGTSAVVLSADDTWGNNRHNTAQFPILQVLIFSDATRGPDNQPVRLDQRTKAWNIYSVIDDVLHDTANVHHQFFGTQVISTSRYSGPSVTAVPDTAGLVRLMVRYEVQVA